MGNGVKIFLNLTVLILSSIKYYVLQISSFDSQLFLPMTEKIIIAIVALRKIRLRSIKRFRFSDLKIEQ